MCPTCKKEIAWENNPTRPFCSERCQLTDLGEWASGKRAIPGDHAPETTEDPKPAPNKDSEE